MNLNSSILKSTITNTQFVKKREKNQTKQTFIHFQSSLTII